MAPSPTIGEIAPKVFISYSWTSQEHQKWVEELAQRLQSNGVHVVIDFWDLREGQDKYAFMEKMVTDSDIKRVLIILDKRYKEKADSRKDGVGSESQIISGELYGKAEQKKFIPIIAEKDEEGKPFLPVYLNSRIYVDLSSPNTFLDQYESLLRNIYERPARQRPALGAPPTFLTESNPGSPATRFRLEEFTKAAEAGTSNSLGHLSRFFDECISSLSAFQLHESPQGPIDEQIISRLQEMKPLRNEVLKAVQCIALYMPEDKSMESLRHFLENAASFQDRPQDLRSWNNNWFDHYKFWLRELFLYVTAILLKRQRYTSINLLTQGEYIYLKSGEPENAGFTVFNARIGSFYDRTSRLGLNRISLVADFIKDRADYPGISFEEIMQADFTLALKSVIGTPRGGWRAGWHPETLVFKEDAFRPFLLYANLRSQRGFEFAKALFHLSSAEEFLKALDTAYKTWELDNWIFDYHAIQFYRLAGLEEMRRNKESS